MSPWIRPKVSGIARSAGSSHKWLDFCVTLRCKTCNHGRCVQAVHAFRYAVDLSDMLSIVRRTLGGVPDDCLGADDPRLFPDGNNCRSDHQDFQRPLSMQLVQEDLRGATKREWPARNRQVRKKGEIFWLAMRPYPQRPDGKDYSYLDLSGATPAKRSQAPPAPVPKLS